MVIISLTTTDFRLPIFKYCLLSLLNQTKGPDKIIINISKEPYLLDKGIQTIPTWLKEFKHQGLIEIKYVKNIGSYRKLLPTLLENISDEDLVITCDDDIIYGPTWLENLVDESHKNPDSIVFSLGRKPNKNIFGLTQSYRFWPLVTETTKEQYIIPIGAGGIVYRKRLLDEKFLYDSSIRSIASKQDDLFFFVASYRQGASYYRAQMNDGSINPIITSLNLNGSNIQNSKKISFLKRFSILSKVSSLALGYLGFSLGDNDIAWKRLKKYRVRSTS